MTVTVSRSATTESETAVAPSLAATPTAVDMSLFSFKLIGDQTVTLLIGMGERRLLVSDLGWSLEQTAAVRAQLAPFERGWDSPEMDAYDAL